VTKVRKWTTPATVGHYSRLVGSGYGRWYRRWVSGTFSTGVYWQTQHPGWKKSPCTMRTTVDYN